MIESPPSLPCGAEACRLLDARLVRRSGLAFWACPRCRGLRIPDGLLRRAELEPDSSGDTPLVMRILMWYRLQWLRATIPEFRRNAARVLDVGCGDGQWLEFLRSRGYQRGVGVEVNRRRLAQAQRRGVAAAERLDDVTPQGPFDVMFLWQVAEHVPEAVALMRELLRHLAPGGIVIISVPNQDSLQTRLFGARSSLIDYGRHVWYWGLDYFRLDLPELVPAIRLRRLPEWNYEYEIYSWTDTFVSLLVGRHNFVHTRLKKGEGTTAEKIAAAVLSLGIAPVALACSVVTLSVPRWSSTHTYVLRPAEAEWP